jgi:predicted amidohydrolase YtcJ
MGLLLRGVELTLGRVVDVQVGGETITEVGRTLPAAPGDEVIDGHGGALLPGLHDHHLHLRATAAAATSVAAGPPEVREANELAAALQRAAAARAPGGWLRGVGYHESVAGPLDRWVLDGMVREMPVRIQHRSGELWMLNSAGVDALGLERSGPAGVERDEAGVPTGRLWRMDRWLGERLRRTEPDLASLSRQAAATGVTGLTDAGPDTTQADADALAALVRSGAIRQRLVLLGPPELAPPAGGGAEVIGTKVLLDDLTLPSLDDLAAFMAAAHAGGRPVAVHCVTRLQLVLTVAALDAAGSWPGDGWPGDGWPGHGRPGDRIEHASVVPAELIPDLKRLGVTVVTQPNFVAERGDDYLAGVDAADRGGLYRLASLLAAGVPVAGGTDAPFGRADVWAAMRAAVRRSTPAGRVVGPAERIGAAAALDLFLGDARAPGRPRRIEPGGPADLCLLSVPRAAALADLDAGAVAMTVIAGQIVSRRA